MVAMTKRITREMTYEAPLAQVAAMLRDTSFRDAVCERQHVLLHTVDVRAEGDAAEVRITREQRVERVPAFAAKFVGESITIETREVWTDLGSGSYSIGIPGKPGQIEGTVNLREQDGVTTETVELTVSVPVPLLGAKLEGVVAELLESALRTEHEVGVAYLAG